MPPVDLDLLARLRAPEGRALVSRAAALVAAGADPLVAAQRMRDAPGGDDHALAAAALTQARLRARARERFGPDADRMLWTPPGLEQATRASVAAHRARRFQAHGGELVADLCCGVGADLVALARAGLRVLGVERDPVTAALAQANAEALGVADRVRVRVDDVTTTSLEGVAAAFLDPARRTATGRRTFDPRSYSPPFSFVAELVARVPATAVKVAPGIPHGLMAVEAEAEWVSDRGEVKEAVLWHGALAGQGVHRRATLLPGGDTLVDDPTLGPPPVGPAGRYLHEPDGAVVRAGLVAEVAAALEGRLLDPRIAYVTTDVDRRSPFTTRYVVDDVLAFSLGRLRAALRERDPADVVVKKRGSAVDVEQLRRRLPTGGAGPPVTVVLTRVGQAPVALLTRPAP